MHSVFFIDYISLFFFTFLGGMIPVLKKDWEGRFVGMLLAFSGAFLLGITFLHLLPDSFETFGSKAGILVLVGYFLQQMVQKFTHGVEHGHPGKAGDQAQEEALKIFFPLFLGLSVHAFSEGLPLGINYTDPTTLPSLTLAIGIHKIPEAMLIIALYLRVTRSVKKAVGLLLVFSAITPCSALLAYLLGLEFSGVQTFLNWCIPVISGIFIQISTTIFYERGNKMHDMKWQKWIAVVAGTLVSLLSLL